MSLRLRLVLSFLSIAALLAAIALVSIREHRVLETEVSAGLRQATEELHDARSSLRQLDETRPGSDRPAGIRPVSEAGEASRRLDRRLGETEAELTRLADRLLVAAGSATRIVGAVSLGALALAVVLGLWLGRSITRSVATLRDAALRIGRGELETRVQLGTRDEMAELGEALDRMAEALGRSTVSKDYLDEVIATMTGALVIVDPKMRIRSANRAAHELLGYAEGELAGQPLDRICPDRDPTNTGSMLRLTDDGRIRNVDLNFVRKNGAVVPVSFSGSTLRDADGRIQEVVCVAYDISERQRMEQRLRTSLREKELLLREVHHRVKNNLQVISSMLELQSEALGDPSLLELVRDSRHRIRSMALIHEQLYRSDDLAEIRLGAYFEDIATHLLRSHGAGDGRVELRLRLVESSLDLDRAIACGLILNELVSNCLEHAFAGDRRGELRIELLEPAPGRLALVVADDGPGFPEGASLERSGSMGLTLVRAMVEQLRGTLELRNHGGAEARLEIPAAPEGAADPLGTGAVPAAVRTAASVTSSTPPAAEPAAPGGDGHGR
ncbi:MAG: PAS domain S-box protein [Holophagales bacterium]|nr:PAS domain S-box protein [Holophagales bacterium]